MTMLAKLWCSVLLAASAYGSSPGVPIPTKPQIQYQRNEIAALIHFNMATYGHNGDPGCDSSNWLKVKDGVSAVNCKFIHCLCFLPVHHQKDNIYAITGSHLQCQNIQPCKTQRIPMGRGHAQPWSKAFNPDSQTWVQTHPTPWRVLSDT